MEYKTKAARVRDGHTTDPIFRLTLASSCHECDMKKSITSPFRRGRLNRKALEVRLVESSMSSKETLCQSIHLKLSCADSMSSFAGGGGGGGEEEESGQDQGTGDG